MYASCDATRRQPGARTAPRPSRAKTTIPPGQPLPGDTDLAILVHTARAGDAEAWTHLVRRFQGTLRHIARSYRLTPDEIDDVVQETWLELVASIERIHDPAAVGGWLATVTRRNALRRRRLQLREELVGDISLGDRADAETPEANVLAAERRTIVAAAVSVLSDRQRQVVTALLLGPGLDYRQVSERLGMPVGSIGPTRARALAQLARDPQLRAAA